MNLQDYRKRKFKTIKAFAEAYGCGASKASGILNGRYHITLSQGEVKHLASVLGVSFIECADACDNTFAELKGYKGNDWKRTPRTHKGIWERWRWEEELQRDAKEAAKNGDWTEFRRRIDEEFAEDRSSRRRQGTQATWTYDQPTCFTILGVSSTATIEQIKAAFRAKVKAAHDGKGGFIG